MVSYSRNAHRRAIYPVWIAPPTLSHSRANEIRFDEANDSLKFQKTPREAFFIVCSILRFSFVLVE